MPLNVSYMGTKRQLSSEVADVISCAPDGPMLDLFAGMCAVGTAVAPARQIWCNDVQVFASSVAHCFFASQSDMLDPKRCISLVKRPFEKNRDALCARFKRLLAIEDRALDSGHDEQIRIAEASLPNCGRSRYYAAEQRRLAEHPTQFSYRLFSITYAGGYFGLRQCIEIDSLRYAIDTRHSDGSISRDQHLWLLLALADLTGLDVAVVVRCKKLLSYPEKYQNMMLFPPFADFTKELYTFIGKCFVV
jgi:adenine-specific DNA-methyltransferase